MMCRFEIDDSSVVEWRWYVDDLNRIPEVVSGLVFEEGRCDEIEELIVNENEWKNVRSIEVKRNGLKGVISVNVNGLNGLELLKVENGGLKNVERIVIGSNSLNGEMVFDMGEDVWKNVKSIEIGSGCLRRVSGEWIDLSRLDDIERMIIGSDSVNGIVNMRMNGLNDLIEVEIGSGSLMTIERIEIGYDSLSSVGCIDMSRFVNMRSIRIGSNCLNHVRSVLTEGLIHLESLIVGERSLMNAGEIEMSNSVDIEWVYEANDMMSVVNAPSVISKLMIGDNCCNEVNFTSLDLSRFVHLKSLVIGKNSLNEIVNITGVEYELLNEVIIGENSLSSLSHS